jgi:chromosome segregation ATPase
MKSYMAILKEKVFAAADELDRTGRNPTLALVRKALGGGSYTSISPWLSEWKANKAEKDSPVREPAPTALSSRLDKLGQEVWAIAMELANGRLAGERATLEAARFRFEAESRERVEMADQISVELESQKARTALLEASERAARVEADELRKQLSAVSERAAIAEARAVEIERHADNIQKELRRVNDRNTELVETFAETVGRIQSKREEIGKPA